jgi:hypothetical protein
VQARRTDYSSEYHRMVVTGLVDHEWAARLQRAATGDDPSERVGEVLAEHGFNSTPELEAALARLDWSAIRAVAQAFDPDYALPEALIC